MTTSTTPSPATAIDRMRPVPAAEDFAALMSEAMSWLPTWCEGVWSDFNAHDPGIMILEQLLYGLTELPYRANLDIDQLLTRDQTGSIPWADNSLYGPTEILPMAPLTAADYARLLYDGIPEVEYAEIAPLPIALRTVAPGVGGRLSARVAINPAVREPDEVLVRVQRLLNHHANLGERFEAVQPMTPVYFSLHAEVELAPDISDQRAGENLFSAVVAAVQPVARFRPLPEVMASEELDQALTGPLLDAGIVATRDLPRLLPWPEAQAAAAQAILNVPGVQAVKATAVELGANAPADAATGAYWFVPGALVTVTTLPGAQTGSLTRKVEFRPTSMPTDALALAAPPPVRIVARPSVRFTRLLPQPDWLVPDVPDEALTEIGSYDSIQRQFPPCFGLGENTLADNATPQRRAQVKQLRGYLLVYEQLLANYFAQLEHTADFFSNRPQSRTVFTQPLSTVPDVLPLIEGYPFDDRTATKVERAAHAEAFWQEPANPYITGLHQAAEDEGRFLTRRSRVLEQLLARFDERYPATPEEATFETIRNREDLLRSYPQLGYQRAQAADFAAAADVGSARPRSGLEQKIQLLLRRDTQPGPTAGSESAHVDARQPADFYFVVETIRFLPTSPATTAGNRWVVLIDALQPALFHVFVNWTYRPLNSAFVAYAEDLVKENMPAHLRPWFIWLETQPHASDDARQFLELFRAWAAAGYPALQLADATPEPIEGSLVVLAGTPAAELLRWLLAHRPAGDAPAGSAANAGATAAPPPPS